MIEKSIGRRIQQYRKAKNLTQEQLSEMVGLTPHHLSAIERGASGIKIEALVNIINILECSADDIFCDVIDSGYKTRSSRLSDKIEALSVENREKVLDVVETLVKTFD